MSSFAASYKFALSHTLADLAVLQGDNLGNPSPPSTKEIESKFVESCLRQSRPFAVGGECSSCILQQNIGKQAAGHIEYLSEPTPPFSPLPPFTHWCW